MLIQIYYKQKKRRKLNLLHSSNIDGLNIVFQSSDLVSQIIQHDLIIFNNTVDLKLSDTVTNRDKLVTTPEETIHGDFLDTLCHGIHISFIIPRLDFKSDGGLCNRLRLGSLLSIIFSKTLSLDSFSFFINFFIIRTEKINVIFVSGFSSRGSFSGPKISKKKETRY